MTTTITYSAADLKIEDMRKDNPAESAFYASWTRRIGGSVRGCPLGRGGDETAAIADLVARTQSESGVKFAHSPNTPADAAILSPHAVVIKYDGAEYRIPSPDGREAGAGYTNDREDAIDTALDMYRRFGFAALIKFRRVAELVATA